MNTTQKDGNTSPGDLLLTNTVDGVTTLTMNNPARLNGWTLEMMAALKAAFASAASDPKTKVLVLTGNGSYYSAGVNLSSTIKLGHPRDLHAMIVRENQALFDMFLDFPKPILIAANGPGLGACVTSATLCDAVIAAEEATFLTPFHALGVTPEGCSSVHFPRLIGEAAAKRMLGKEGWKPNAAEALEIGLVQWVVPAGELLHRAQEIAAQWVVEGKERSFQAGATREGLKEVNASESRALADAFLSKPFLDGQYRFLRRKKKWGPALMFLGLRITQPAWSRLI
jgi:enoyl-CoA hydratase/carnithine racemase